METEPGRDTNCSSYETGDTRTDTGSEPGRDTNCFLSVTIETRADMETEPNKDTTQAVPHKKQETQEQTRE